MFTILSLLGGLIFLAMGGAGLVRGTAGLAQQAGIPAFIIGLVAVGFGSSAPQLFTAFQATISGDVEMAIATAIGASIFNIFATLGLVALGGGAVHLDKRLWVRGSVGLMVIAAIVAGSIVALTAYGLPLPRWSGALGLILLITYVTAAHAYEHQHPTDLPLLKETRKLHPIILAGIFAAGIFGLILGANLMVDAANQLSTRHGLNPRFLGLTVLAVGTALPQLLTTYLAYSDKKQHTLLLSTLINNTIFNLLGVCGLLIMLNPVQLHRGILLNSFVILATATVAFLIFTHPAMRRFKRAEAILFLFAYGLFIAYTLHTL